MFFVLLVWFKILSVVINCVYFCVDLFLEVSWFDRFVIIFLIMVVWFFVFSDLVVVMFLVEGLCGVGVL